MLALSSDEIDIHTIEQWCQQLGLLNVWGELYMEAEKLLGTDFA